MSDNPSLDWLNAYLRRLDEGHPGWRSLNGQDRPVDVVGHATTGPAKKRSHPAGRVRLLDFLSPSWGRRSKSGGWAFSRLAGQPVSHASLETYLRSGGLVAVVDDLSWAGPGTTGSSVAHEATPPLIEGDPGEWASSLSLTRMFLLQLGNAGYVGDSDALARLNSLIADVWHPLLAWHVDVVDCLVRGFDRHRYTATDFEQHGSHALHGMALQLAQNNVRSQPILLSA